MHASCHGHVPYCMGNKIWSPNESSHDPGLRQFEPPAAEFVTSSEGVGRCDTHSGVAHRVAWFDLLAQFQGNLSCLKEAVEFIHLGAPARQPSSPYRPYRQTHSALTALYAKLQVWQTHTKRDLVFLAFLDRDYSARIAELQVNVTGDIVDLWACFDSLQFFVYWVQSAFRCF